MDSIGIAHMYKYHGSIVFGLSLTSDRKNLVVGCSIRTREQKIIDIPARRLISPGLALWNMRAPEETFVHGDYSDYWIGQIIFALWEGSGFTKRLADTGWVQWEAPWMIGASTKGLDYQDEEINDTYRGRLPKDTWEE